VPGRLAIAAEIIQKKKQQAVSPQQSAYIFHFFSTSISFLLIFQNVLMF